MGLQPKHPNTIASYAWIESAAIHRTEQLHYEDFSRILPFVHHARCLLVAVALAHHTVCGAPERPLQQCPVWFQGTHLSTANGDAPSAPYLPRYRQGDMQLMEVANGARVRHNRRAAVEQDLSDLRWCIDIIARLDAGRLGGRRWWSKIKQPTRNQSSLPAQWTSIPGNRIPWNETRQHQSPALH